MADSVTAKVLRFDPSLDAAPAYRSYDVPWQEDESGFMTGLQVLNVVNEQENLGYDFCCRSGLCGRCSMVIDGESRLACWTRIEPGEHTFEPLPGFPEVRDLVVDRRRAYDRILKVTPQTQTVDPIVKLKNIDKDLWWNTLERINMCRECMCCYSVCTALQTNGDWDSFAGPAAMMVIAQHYLDTRDQSDRIAQSVFEGVFDCVQCGNCTKVCPSRITITEIIGDMQKAAEARGLRPATA